MERGRRSAPAGAKAAASERPCELDRLSSWPPAETLAGLGVAAAVEERHLGNSFRPRRLSIMQRMSLIVALLALGLGEPPASLSRACPLFRPSRYP